MQDCDRRSATTFFRLGQFRRFVVGLHSINGIGLAVITLVPEEVLSDSPEGMQGSLETPYPTGVPRMDRPTSLPELLLDIAENTHLFESVRNQNGANVSVRLETNRKSSATEQLLVPEKGGRFPFAHEGDVEGSATHGVHHVYRFR